MQGKTIRDSFIVRGEKSLEKIAQFNKLKAGSNIVFTRVSPTRGAEVNEEAGATEEVSSTTFVTPPTPQNPREHEDQ